MSLEPGDKAHFGTPRKWLPTNRRSDRLAYIVIDEPTAWVELIGIFSPVDFVPVKRKVADPC